MLICAKKDELLEYVKEGTVIKNIRFVYFNDDHICINSILYGYEFDVILSSSDNTQEVCILNAYKDSEVRYSEDTLGGYRGFLNFKNKKEFLKFKLRANVESISIDNFHYHFK